MAAMMQHKMSPENFMYNGLFTLHLQHPYNMASCFTKAPILHRGARCISKVLILSPRGEAQQTSLFPLSLLGKLSIKSKIPYKKSTCPVPPEGGGGGGGVSDDRCMANKVGMYVW